jgi:hypothetical protein
MAGEAKSNSFMLGSATVMLGAQADLFTLNPANHAVGLVKNFTISNEPQYSELTQGVKNQIVYSVMTSNRVTAQMEVYEYTSKNIAYALGLNGSALTSISASTTIGTAYTSGTSLLVTSATGLLVGDWIMIQSGSDDLVFYRRITAISTNTLTLNAAIPIAIPITPTNNTFVQKVNPIDVGSQTDQPFLSAKIVGSLADGTEIGILIPKIRITAGFTLGFTTDNFGNLPLEFTCYDLTASDPNYADFTNKQAILFTPK